MPTLDTDAINGDIELEADLDTVSDALHEWARHVRVWIVEGPTCDTANRCAAGSVMAVLEDRLGVDTDTASKIVNAFSKKQGARWKPGPNYQTWGATGTMGSTGTTGNLQLSGAK